MLAAKLNVKPLNANNVPAPGLGALGGFRAISSDDDTGSIMYNAEVEQAIVENFGSNKLDLVGFDACLSVMIGDWLCPEIVDRPDGCQRRARAQ